MNPRVLGLIPLRKSCRMVGLYAYSSHGLPGLDILGLGGQGKCLKEKVIYLGRERGLTFPSKRYMISVEGCENFTRDDRRGLKFLELAVIVLFWMMAGHLHLRKPQDCLVSGHIGLNGAIYPPSAPPHFWQDLAQVMSERRRCLTVIGPAVAANSDFLRCFEVGELRTVLGLGKRAKWNMAQVVS